MLSRTSDYFKPIRNHCVLLQDHHPEVKYRFTNKSLNKLWSTCPAAFTFTLYVLPGIHRHKLITSPSVFIDQLTWRNVILRSFKFNKKHDMQYCHCVLPNWVTVIIKRSLDATADMAWLMVICTDWRHSLIDDTLYWTQNKLRIMIGEVVTETFS